MAITLQQIWGGGTGGLEQFSATNSTPTMVTSPVKWDTHSVQLNGTDSVDILDLKIAEDRHKFAFYMEFDGSPSAAYIFFEADSGAGVNVSLRLNTDRTITIMDANDSALVTTSDVVPVDEMVLIELAARTNAVGQAWVRINKGTEAVTGASVDLVSASSSTTTGRFLAGGSITSWLSDYYSLTTDTDTGLDTTLFIDGDFVVKTYQPGPGSTEVFTPSVGSVDNLEHRPIVEEGTAYGVEDSGIGVAYAQTNASSGNEFTGPSGDGDINTVFGALYAGWLVRGSGSPSDHSLVGYSTTKSTNTVAISTTQSYALYEFITDDIAIFPEDDNHAIIGLHKTSGGRDLYAADLLCTVLSDVDVTPPPNIPFIAQAIMVQ